MMRDTRFQRHSFVPYLLGATIASTLGVTASVQAAGKALEEVIVTAQKRDESVQAVPISMTALTQESLTTNRVATVTDLSGLAPNLTSRPAPGGAAIAAFSMRGITSYGLVPGSDKEISIYLDGVYIGSPRGSIFSLPDIAQLEVLRGPQGTLFGRNATAGAINITTRDPSGDFGFRQELSAGDHNYRRNRTSVESPTWGPFSFLATYANEERDGDIKNTQAGIVWDRTAFGGGTSITPKRFGDKDAETYFLAAKFQPTDTISMTYKVDHSIDHGTPSPNVLIHLPAGPLKNAVDGGVFGPNASPVVTNYKRPNSTGDAWVTSSDQSNTGHSLTTLVDVSDSVSIKNITAYRKARITSATDLTGLGNLSLGGVPFCIACNQVDSDSDQWSTEFQVNYEFDWLTLTVGALYFESEERTGYQNAGTTYAQTSFPGRVIPAGGISTAYNSSQSLAAYTQAEFHLTDTVDLVAGVRETRDRKSGDFLAATKPPAAPAIIHYPFTYENTKPSYTLGVNYKPTFDTLIYGKYSNAFVSGGSTAGLAYEAETAKAWEAGVKSDFLNSTLRTNLSVFYVTYSNVQSPQTGQNVSGYENVSTLIVGQGAETNASGFELETSASVGYGITLNGSVGYTHIVLDGDINPILLKSVEADNPNYPGSKFLPGSTPPWTANLGAQYESDPLFGESYLALNLGGSWHSAIRLEQNPARAAGDPGLLEFTPASWVVNARAALKKIDLGFGQGEIGLWGRNLTDNDEPTYALNLAGRAQTANYMEARSYGVDLIFQY